MPIELTPDRPTRSSTRGLFVLTLAGLGIIGLQIGLPWFSWSLNHIPEARIDPDMPDESSFWQRRFRFEQFLDPGSGVGLEKLNFVSGTVCGDEIVILLKTIVHALTESWSDPSDILRINLRNGRITRTAAPPQTRYVLSNGKTLWLLPECHYGAKPFLWQGAPVVIQHDSGLSILSEFGDGHWQATDQFVHIPVRLLDFYPSVANGQFQFLIAVGPSHDDIWYRTSLNLLTKEEAQQIEQQFPLRIFDFSEEQVQKAGWSCAFCDHQNDNVVGYPLPLGYWFEDGVPCSLRLTAAPNQFANWEFLWHRYPAGEPTQKKSVPWPTHWTRRGAVASWIIGHTSYRTVVTSAEGDVYVVAHQLDDGRIEVFRWQDGQLRVVVQHSSPWIWLLCLDGGLFIVFCWAMPMLLWTGFAASIQRRNLPKPFVAGREAVILASVVRRAGARLIDVSLLALLLTLSIVSDPHAFGWWKSIAWTLKDLWFQLLSVDLRNPGWTWSLRGDLEELIVELVTVPRFWPLIIVAVVMLVAQTIWQARSGRTIGKWFLGIRVVRTTLRPCGIARSLLREIYLALDSLLLLSWVPGVIAILVSKNSQRFGDRWADTIVIRDARGPGDSVAGL